MIPYKTFAVLGGDLRQAYIANRLASQGKSVYALLLEKNEALDAELICDDDPQDILPACDVVIFPLPLTTDERTVNAPYSDKTVKIADCLACLKPNAAVLAGKVSHQLQAQAKSFGVTIVDYLEREELAVKNAVITAEGAVAIALEELPIALFGANCLVTGYGRIAKSLMRILTGLGAHVTTAARKYGDLAAIEAAGCQAVHMSGLAECAANVDVIFNTVPARILNKEVLAGLRRDTLVIDLASKPGGVDLEAAGGLGVKTIWALSLPGKTAPITAAEIILDTIGNCLTEQGVR